MVFCVKSIRTYQNYIKFYKNNNHINKFFSEMFCILFFYSNQKQIHNEKISKTTTIIITFKTEVIAQQTY